MSTAANQPTTHRGTSPRKEAIMAPSTTTQVSSFYAAVATPRDHDEIAIARLREAIASGKHVANLPFGRTIRGCKNMRESLAAREARFLADYGYSA